MDITAPIVSWLGIPCAKGSRVFKKVVCLTGEKEILNAMLATGYDINTQDENGDTALVKAARRDSTRLPGFRCLLIEAGADPDLRNAAGVSFRTLANEDKNLALELELSKR